MMASIDFSKKEMLADNTYVLVSKSKSYAATIAATITCIIYVNFVV